MTFRRNTLVEVLHCSESSPRMETSVRTNARNLIDRDYLKLYIEIGERKEGKASKNNSIKIERIGTKWQ